MRSVRTCDICCCSCSGSSGHQTSTVPADGGPGWISNTAGQKHQPNCQRTNWTHHVEDCGNGTDASFYRQCLRRIWIIVIVMAPTIFITREIIAMALFSFVVSCRSYLAWCACGTHRVRLYTTVKRTPTMPTLRLITGVQHWVRASEHAPATLQPWNRAIVDTRRRRPPDSKLQLSATITYTVSQKNVTLFIFVISLSNFIRFC